MSKEGVSGMPPSYNGPTPEHQTPAYKAAKLAVIVLSVLILLALVALVVGGIRAMSGKGAAHHGAPGAFQLPPGARIVEMQSQPGRLLLRLRDGDGEQVVIVDTQDGHLVSRIKTSR